MSKIIKTTEDNILPVEIISVFPLFMRGLLGNLPNRVGLSLQEIRIRLGRPIILSIGGHDYSVNLQGKLIKDINQGYQISVHEMERIIHSISQSSVYAWEEEFKRGYLTVKGGHRIGLVGKVVLDNGFIKSMKNISGLNIRLAHELIGVANQIMPYILDQKLGFGHTLLLSPPQCGKTTLLRDIIRQLSDGVPDLKFPGVNVGLVDERSELAGCYEGRPQFKVGIRTDILDACPKAQGMMMLIRSMSPRVIATDEIGTEEDLRAINEVLSAGINLLTTVHATNIGDLLNRSLLRQIIENKLFKRIIILSCSLGVGTIEDIVDGVSGQSLLPKPLRGEWISG